MVEGGSAEWLVGRDHRMGGCRTVVVAGEWENDEKEGRMRTLAGSFMSIQAPSISSPAVEL